MHTTSGFIHAGFQVSNCRFHLAPVTSSHLIECVVALANHANTCTYKSKVQVVRDLLHCVVEVVRVHQSDPTP